MSRGAAPGKERADARRLPRTPVDLEAALGGRTPRKSRVADLSLAGCLLRTESELARGAVLDLTLWLPDGPLSAKGRVIDASLDGEAPPDRPSYLNGVAFLALGAADEARLRAFLGGEAERRRGAHPPTA